MARHCVARRIWWDGRLDYDVLRRDSIYGLVALRCAAEACRVSDIHRGSDWPCGPRNAEAAFKATRPDGAERAGLHQRVAERGGLDRPGHDRQAAGVGGELAEQRVAGAAADDVHDVDVPAGQPLRVGARRARWARARLSRMQRTIAGRAGRHRLAGARGRRRRSGPACRPAAGTPGRPGRRPRRTAGTRGRLAQQRRPGRPAPPRRAGDSCSSHRPMTLRR